MTDPAPMGERVLLLYADAEEPSKRFHAWTEEQQPVGWVVLGREEQCPGGCMAGEVLWDSDLHACRTCNGHGVVSVGIGGAFLYGSYPQPIPEEPDLCDYRNELRHFIPAPLVASHD